MNNSQRVDSLWRIFQQIDDLMTSDEVEMYPVLDELKVFILDLSESDGFLIPESKKDEPGNVVDFLKWLKKINLNQLYHLQQSQNSYSSKNPKASHIKIANSKHWQLMR